MTIDHVLLALFVLVMLANIWALARHFVMMRIMTTMLQGLIDSQRQFDELINERRPMK